MPESTVPSGSVVVAPNVPIYFYAKYRASHSDGGELQSMHSGGMPVLIGSTDDGGVDCLRLRSV
jgi:hypothetical protein